MTTDNTPQPVDFTKKTQEFTPQPVKEMVEILTAHRCKGLGRCEYCVQIVEKIPQLTTEATKLYNDAVRDGVERAYKKVSESKLVELVRYGFPRQVGHTWTEVNGVANNPTALLLVASRLQMPSTGLPKEKQITVDEIPNKLCGVRVPIVVDHYALHVMVEDVLHSLTTPPKQDNNKETTNH